MTEQIALRFPDGTKDRIKAASLPGESMTGVILRALTQIDNAAPAPDQIPDIRADLAALAARVAALEASRRREVVEVDKIGTEEVVVIEEEVVKVEEVVVVGSDPERLSAQTRAAELKSAGESFRKIAATLHAEGYPTRSGRGQWQPGSVKDMLG
ncbi:recombinase family protein [uncultured Thiocystis sp.]|jgi:hypothetical protein|uniref:recombinase family protein n=1 Tax=uncultured Thiocystis sp. TaxID=1202134 RepID=UPI0025D5271B|nr:recombinase family protein [uncultured Thiocystis sp.]